MALSAIQKTPAYFSRYQVKFRRRREGKTDFQQRRNLIKQDLNKYQAKKYRFIVRISNSRVFCQIAYASLAGDVIVCAAESSELHHYGMPVGLTNYSAAYATGLLCARRCLKKFKLDKMIPSNETIDGSEYHIENEDLERRPFKALLDVGLSRVTTGARVFGALKGATDGGLYIPHSIKRFPGFTKGEDGSEDAYDAEKHRMRIFGVHVAEYMKQMKNEDSSKYQAHFSRYIKAGINEDNLEQKFKAVHDAIRTNSDRIKVASKKCTHVRQGNYIVTTGPTGREVRYYRPKKLTRSQRGERVQKKIAEVARVAAEAMGEA